MVADSCFSRLIKMGGPATKPNFALFELPDNNLTKTPIAIPASSYSGLQILETAHLEKWIAAVPTLLGEELMIVTRQFAGFDRTQERFDLLAIDRNAKLVVVEIKRDTSGSRQDLQAIRYAAYCSRFTKKDIVELYCIYKGQRDKPLPEDKGLADLSAFVTASLDDLDTDTCPRILLVAKSYQDEMAWTCLWLIDNFGIDIKCVQLVPYKVGRKTLLASAVRIPLPEAVDYAISRNAKKQKLEAKGQRLNWESVKSCLLYTSPSPRDRTRSRMPSSA